MSFMSWDSSSCLSLQSSCSIWHCYCIHTLYQSATYVSVNIHTRTHIYSYSQADTHTYTRICLLLAKWCEKSSPKDSLQYVAFSARWAGTKYCCLRLKSDTCLVLSVLSSFFDSFLTDLDTILDVCDILPSLTWIYNPLILA